jgi:23S rRNA pseudouridine1911/1915/1917 synthase
VGTASPNPDQEISPLSPRIVRVWDKPAGLPVLPPNDDPAGDCVVARLLLAEPERARIAWPAGFEAGVLHRLDTSTSGAVALADDPADLEHLRAAFATGKLVKQYCLRAARDPGWDTNDCERALAHDPRHKGRMVVQRGRDTPHRGRWLPAHTRFRRRHGTLFDAVIRTGVMHQIRVHAAFVGIPILGDRRYGGGETPEGAPPGLVFYLHHVGFSSADPALETAPVPLPDWARDPP